MTDETGSRTPRRIKWLLAVSLALNLAVVGFVAGAIWRHDGPGERFARAPGSDSYAAPYVMALPRAERREIFRDLRSLSRDTLPDRGARREMYREVIAALRADPYDRALLSAALERQKDAALAVQSAVQGIWLDRVSAMSTAERADYAYAVEEMLRRGSKRRRE